MYLCRWQDRIASREQHPHCNVPRCFCWVSSRVCLYLSALCPDRSRDRPVPFEDRSRTLSQVRATDSESQIVRIATTTPPQLATSEPRSTGSIISFAARRRRTVPGRFVGSMRRATGSMRDTTKFESISPHSSFPFATYISLHAPYCLASCNHSAMAEAIKKTFADKREQVSVFRCFTTSHTGALLIIAGPSVRKVSKRWYLLLELLKRSQRTGQLLDGRLPYPRCYRRSDARSRAGRHRHHRARSAVQ